MISVWLKYVTERDTSPELIACLVASNTEYETEYGLFLRVYNNETNVFGVFSTRTRCAKGWPHIQYCTHNEENDVFTAVIAAKRSH